MNEVYIKKDSLQTWVAKYFKKDLISIDDLICFIEDLLDDNDNLRMKLEELERDIEDNYKPISQAEQYDISERDFI